MTPGWGWGTPLEQGGALRDSWEARSGPGWGGETHLSVRMLMGYRTGMLVVSELSPRRPGSSLSLHGAGKGRVERRAWPELQGSVSPGQGCGGVAGPAHQLTLACSSTESPQELFSTV